MFDLSISLESFYSCWGIPISECWHNISVNNRSDVKRKVSVDGNLVETGNPKYETNQRPICETLPDFEVIQM